MTDKPSPSNEPLQGYRRLRLNPNFSYHPLDGIPIKYPTLDSLRRKEIPRIKLPVVKGSLFRTSWGLLQQFLHLLVLGLSSSFKEFHLGQLFTVSSVKLSPKSRVRMTKKVMTYDVWVHLVDLMPVQSTCIG